MMIHENKGIIQIHSVSFNDTSPPVLILSARDTQNLHHFDGQGIIHINQALQNIGDQLRIVHHLEMVAMCKLQRLAKQSETVKLVTRTTCELGNQEVEQHITGTHRIL